MHAFVPQPEDIIVDWLRINYAMQDRNPVDNIRFFSRYNDFQALKIPRSKVSFLVPEQYEELAIRIFTRDSDKVGRVKRRSRHAGTVAHAFGRACISKCEPMNNHSW